MTNPNPSPQQGSTPPKPQAPVGNVQIVDEDLLDLQVLDPKTLQADRHYRAVRADETAIAKARRRGYEVEVIKDGGVRTLIPQPTGGDKAIRMGDRVLMSCPKARHEARQRAKVKKTAERIGSVQQVTRQKAKEIEQKTGHSVEIITDKE